MFLNVKSKNGLHIIALYFRFVVSDILIHKVESMETSVKTVLVPCEGFGVSV